MSEKEMNEDVVWPPAPTKVFNNRDIPASVLDLQRSLRPFVLKMLQFALIAKTAEMVWYTFQVVCDVGDHKECF